MVKIGEILLTLWISLVMCSRTKAKILVVWPRLWGWPYWIESYSKSPIFILVHLINYMHCKSTFFPFLFCRMGTFTDNEVHESLSRCTSMSLNVPEYSCFPFCKIGKHKMCIWNLYKEGQKLQESLSLLTFIVSEGPKVFMQFSNINNFMHKIVISTNFPGRWMVFREALIMN